MIERPVCHFCINRMKLKALEWGKIRVIGCSRLCAECGEERIPHYNVLQCPVCKEDSVAGISWLHDWSNHVTCYNSISDMKKAGLIAEVKPLEYISLRQERVWPGYPRN